MCEPTTIMMGLAAAGAATSAIGAMKQADAAKAQGEQAQAMGNYQQAQAEADAAAAQGEASVQADLIRNAGKRQRSAAIAGSAASGLSVSDGTAELINNEIDRNTEQDALTTILSGRNRASQIRVGGQAAKISGDNAKQSAENAADAALIGGASSALRAGSSIYGGWKSTAIDPIGSLNRSNRRMVD